MKKIIPTLVAALALPAFGANYSVVPNWAKVPTGKNKKWTNNEIDQFVLRKLEGVKLTPNGPAESRVLIRSLYFDLIGLPPTPKEVDDFVKASLVNPQ